jgi:hypothetical protein
MAALPAVSLAPGSAEGLDALDALVESLGALERGDHDGARLALARARDAARTAQKLHRERTATPQDFVVVFRVEGDLSDPEAIARSVARTLDGSLVDAARCPR